MSNLKKVGVTCIISSVIFVFLALSAASSQEVFTVTGFEPYDGETNVSVYRGVLVHFPLTLKRTRLLTTAFL